jgi:hypothetical protein
MEKTVAVQRLEDIWRLQIAQIRPQPLTVFKPQKNGNGVAARVNLRLRPQYPEDKEYIEDVDGGLFIDLVAQGPEKNGFPTFKWAEKDAVVTAKLGLVDVSILRAAIRDFRVRGIDVATYLRGRNKELTNVVSLFHQTDSSGTTGITYTFDAESSLLKISKSKDQFKTVSLTLHEELQFDAYLEHAMRAFILLGVR